MFALLVTLLTPAFACGDKPCDGACAMPAAGETAAAPIPAGSTVATLKVTGMHCGACAEKVTAALKGVPGVTVANVSVEKGQAEVGYDASKTNVDALVKAVNTQTSFTAAKL